MTQAYAGIGCLRGRCLAAQQRGLKSVEVILLNSSACTQDLLDSAARPFVGITDALPAGSLLGAAAVVAVVGGIAAWRFAVYSRREYIVAAMLRKYVPKGEPGIEIVNLRRNRPHIVGGVGHWHPVKTPQLRPAQQHPRIRRQLGRIACS